jgi:DNA repair exonuclease SbcCD ATPase subunit
MCQKDALEKSDGCENNYQAEIESLESEIAKISKMLYLADFAQEGSKELENLNKELENVKETCDKVVSYKSSLAKSEKIEESLFLIKKNEEVIAENDNLDKNISELSKKLDSLRADYEKEELGFENLEKDYSLSLEKLKQATTLFESYVLGGVSLADKESVLHKKMSSYYEEHDKKAETLSEKFTTLSEEYETLSLELSQTNQALQDTKYPTSVKKAVRDGLVIETSLASKIAFLEKVDAEIVEANDRIETLKTQIKRNEQELSDAKSKSELKLGRDVTYKQIYAQLNEDEKQKQTLYRNQIIIANTEREIGAVDNKIYENEEAQRSYIEDKNVLENAKNTLLGYIKKLDDKLDSIDEKLVLVSAQKKYHDAIDTATFGDKCPVCKGAILEKSDFSKESKAIEKAYNDLLIEKQKANLVKKDYDKQLEKINIRLGELSSRIDTSITYLASLIETKTAKYDLVKKLLDTSSARSFSALTNILDAAIKKVAITTNEFIEVAKFSLLETILLRGIEDATNEISHLENIVLKNANSIKENTEKVIENFNKELTSLSKELGEATAEKKAIALFASEKAQEELEEKLTALSIKENGLLEKMAKVEKELIAIASRDDTILVEKDGESLTYNQLFASLLKDNYSEHFNLLKTLDDEKQALQDKYMETFRAVKIKGEETNALSKEISIITASKNSNQRMLDLLNENAKFNPSDFNAQDIDTITQEKKKEMLAFIKENEKNEEIILAKIKVLNDSLELNKSYIDSYDKNLSAKASLLSKLDKTRSLLVSKEKGKANFDFVANEIENAKSKLDFTKGNLEQIKAIKEKDLTFLMKKDDSAQGEISALISLEKAINEIAKDDTQLLHRFITLPASKYDENEIAKVKDIVSPYNISIITSI